MTLLLLSSTVTAHCTSESQTQARLETFCCDCIVSHRRAISESPCSKGKKCTTGFPHSAQGDPLSILTFITKIQEGLKAFGFPYIILLKKKSCIYRLLLSQSISLLSEPRDSISPAVRACTSPSSKAIPCQIQEGKQNTSLLAKCLHANLCNCPRLWRGPRVHTALTLSLEIQINQMHQTQLTGWFLSNLHRWWLRKVTLIRTCWEKIIQCMQGKSQHGKLKVNSFICTSPSSSISAHGV